MICSLKFWARMAAINAAAALTVGFAFNGVTLHTPWPKAAEIMGVTHRTMRRWRDWLNEGGYRGLWDYRKRRPSPKRVPMATAEKVLHL